uniref:Uncharacterized protein n=1 Tax=Hippocampus comes TaxID=109280 RepID=A0A3Q2YYL7_HIPCM
FMVYLLQCVMAFLGITLLTHGPKNWRGLQAYAYLFNLSKMYGFSTSRKELLTIVVNGYPGTRGFPGFDASAGEKGIAGTFGLPGVPGRKGFKGDQGSGGYRGTNGISGKKGRFRAFLTGEKGEQGTMGTPGQIGVKGERGPYGPKGDAGPPGKILTNYMKTSDWLVPSLRGLPGNQGPLAEQSIVPGERGLPGRQGIQGPRGIQGESGPRGPPGDAGQFFFFIFEKSHSIKYIGVNECNKNFSLIRGNIQMKSAIKDSIMCYLII